MPPPSPKPPPPKSPPPPSQPPKESVLGLPKTAELLAEASLAQERGDHEAAIRLASLALDIEDSAAGQRLRGKSNEKAGHLDEARGDYNRALELDPKDATVWQWRGELREHAGDFAGALDDLGRAIELAPRDATPLALRGEYRWAHGDNDGAIADSTKAIELQPELGVAWGWRAAAKFAKTRGVDATILEDSEKAIQLAPEHYIGWYMRGRLRTVRMAFADARSDLGKAIDRAPVGVKPPIHYARALAKMGVLDNDGALEDLDAAIKIDPRHRNSLAKRADLRAAKGDRKGAAEDLEAVLATGEGTPASQAALRKRLEELRK